jgi:hypothetical protein
MECDHEDEFLEQSGSSDRRGGGRGEKGSFARTDQEQELPHKVRQLQQRRLLPPRKRDFGLVLLDDLLSQVILITDFFNLVQLRLDPVYVLFLVHEDMLQQFPRRIVAGF